jgi:hypothetical protein
MIDPNEATANICSTKVVDRQIGASLVLIF